MSTISINKISSKSFLKPTAPVNIWQCLSKLGILLEAFTRAFSTCLEAFFIDVKSRQVAPVGVLTDI